MSYRSRFLLPALGQGDGGGRVVNWLKQPGEAFSRDEVLLEVETDKALVEVPAPADGLLLEHIAAVDDTVELDGPLAEVEFEGEAPEPASAEPLPATADATTGPGPSPSPATGPPASPGDTAPARAGERVFATPYARKLAQERGIDLAVLAGSGKGGRIVAADVRGADARHTHAESGPSPQAIADPGLANRDSDSQERRIPIGSGEVFARTWLPARPATRSTLVLLHGLFGDGDAWSATAPLLARRGIPVVAPDLPGHGRTTSVATDFATVVEQVTDLVHRLVDGPVVLVGHSFGGAVAARAATAPALAVAALGLIAPLGLGTEIGRHFLDGMLGARSLEAVRREMRKLTARTMPLGDEYLATLHERIGSRHRELAALCDAMAAGGVQQVDIVPDLEAIATPVVLVHGRADRIIPWEHALNAPPATALHLLPGDGHMPQWESGALTTRLLAAVCGT